MWMFTPPTYNKRENRKDSRFGYNQAVGLSVVKRGSDYEVVASPDASLWDTADMVYLGGHTYEVSSAEAALLMAAGHEPVEI